MFDGEYASLQALSAMQEVKVPEPIKVNVYHSSLNSSHVQTTGVNLYLNQWTQLIFKALSQFMFRLVPYL